MKTVRARAHSSTANLGHGLDVFGLCLDIGSDVVEIQPAQSGFTLEVTGEKGAGLPSDPRRNTAGLAIATLMEHHARTDPIHVRVEKGTRPGSGLGSSAASAAAAVVAADAYFGLGLSREQMVHFAAEGERAAAGAAHPDNVAASIFGGLTICTADRPPHVVHLTPPDWLRFAVALPAIEVTTAASRQALPKQISLREYSQGCARSIITALALLNGDIEAFGRAMEGSFIEAARAPLIPGHAAVVAAAKAAGAAGVTISGAGPAMIAAVPRNSDAQAIAQAMRAGFSSAGVASDIYVAPVGKGAHIVESAES